MTKDYRQPPPQDPASSGLDETDAEPGDDQSVETRASFVGEAAHGQRLDRFLVDMAEEFSRSHLQSLIERGCVRLDGATQSSSSRRLRAGQRVEVDLRPTAQSQAFRPQPMSLRIVYEDEHLLVLDKPAGLVVHPAAGHWQGTLLNGLLAHHAAAAALPRAGIVHRLDKDTSGLMVVAKTLEAVAALVRAMSARDVRREYIALCHGCPEPAQFSVDAPIGRDRASRVRMAVVRDGKPARTDVDRLACRDGFAALRCRLHTGRTHQIRVHLAWRGHPLVGDALYGGAPALGLSRQALHAERLAFVHPLGGRWMDFVAPAPADLATAWQAVCPPQRAGRRS
jgi:23S rRNA pseudouridine1911/1915/1917 synthase